VADAELIAEHRLQARVVKGEWEDPADPGRDPVEGVRALVGALAGRAPHVAIATHDAALAAACLDRLLEHDTPCELQVLYAIDGRAAIDEARRRDVPIACTYPTAADGCRTGCESCGRPRWRASRGTWWASTRRPGAVAGGARTRCPPRPGTADPPSALHQGNP
jgi:hypothetical protein